MKYKLALLILSPFVMVACAPSNTPKATSSPTVVSGAGNITPIIERYRQLLGGVNNNGEPGSKTSGYRELNWDSVPDEIAAPNFYTPDFFNATTAPRARGAVLSTPGKGLMVSASNSNPTGTLPRFGNINPSYASTFKTFSNERLFSPVGSNIADIRFFVPGTKTPATVQGFGAVYTDVDTEHTAFEYFDINDNSLGSFGTPIADNGLSFLGVIFEKAIVHRVRIQYGTAALGSDDASNNDVAVMDNFVYGEPKAIKP